MKISPFEKLVITMLADIYAHHKIKGEIDAEMVKSAILGGHTWAIDWQYPTFKIDDDADSDVKETADILGMWFHIDNTVGPLSATEKSNLEKDVYPHSIYFEGFDGNGDTHMGIAQFMVQELDRFPERKGGPFNSHSAMSLPHYRAMLGRYKIEVANHNYNLTSDQVRKIIKG